MAFTGAIVAMDRGIRRSHRLATRARRIFPAVRKVKKLGMLGRLYRRFSKAASFGGALRQVFTKV